MRKRPQASRAERLIELARKLLEHERAIVYLRQEMERIVSEVTGEPEREGPPEPRVAQAPYTRPPTRPTNASRVLDFYGHPDRFVLVNGRDVVRAMAKHGTKETVTHVVLSKLVAAGLLRRPNRGCYVLVGNP